VIACAAPEDRGDHFSISAEPKSHDLSSAMHASYRAITARRDGSLRRPAIWRVAALILAGLIASGPATTAGPASGTATTLQVWTNGPRPPFALDNLAGARIELSAFTGRVVLVHFFATWCEPCRDELSSLDGLAARHASRPLTILAINVAETAPRVRRFFETNPVSFPVVLDTDRAVTRTWGVEMLPTTIVLDTQLKPVLVAAGDLAWDRPDADAAITALMPDKKPH
jgi:thiol-disulfide isomerase/thioredoxin